MNASNAKEYLPLVQALAEGRVLQLNYNGDWKDISDMEPIYPANFYRIKPEPREIWVIESVDGSQNGHFISEFEANAFCRKGYKVIRCREVIE